jgi:hypothetical protein
MRNLREAGHPVPEIDDEGFEEWWDKWLAHPTAELDELRGKSWKEIYDDWRRGLLNISGDK